MKVHTDIDLLAGFRNAAVTIGTFDGVHLGHQKIISQLKSEAIRVNGETVIITFHPHPRKIVANANKSIKLITTIEERIELLSSKGVDHLVIVPFTKGFSELQPGKYVEDFLVARFHPSVVIIGYDHKFGMKRSGDYKLLEEYSAKGLFELREIPQHLINDSTVSSTRIRENLSAGDIDSANSLLGYDFYFGGTVMHGDKRGRTIGYPTANIRTDNEEKIIPGNGVYAVEIKIEKDEKVYQGMMNIGVRPTVDGSTKTTEVNIFDFDGDIYDRSVRVIVKYFLRPEQKFNGLETLTAQLAKDKEDALERLRET